MGLMSIFVKICSVHTPSSNPRLKPARPLSLKRGVRTYARTHAFDQEWKRAIRGYVSHVWNRHVSACQWRCHWRQVNLIRLARVLALYLSHRRHLNSSSMMKLVSEENKDEYDFHSRNSLCVVRSGCDTILCSLRDPNSSFFYLWCTGTSKASLTLTRSLRWKGFQRTIRVFSHPSSAALLCVVFLAYATTHVHLFVICRHMVLGHIVSTIIVRRTLPQLQAGANGLLYNNNSSSSNNNNHNNNPKDNPKCSYEAPARQIIIRSVFRIKRSPLISNPSFSICFLCSNSNIFHVPRLSLYLSATPQLLHSSISITKSDITILGAIRWLPTDLSGLNKTPSLSSHVFSLSLSLWCCTLSRTQLVYSQSWTCTFINSICTNTLNPLISSGDDTSGKILSGMMRFFTSLLSTVKWNEIVLFFLSLCYCVLTLS